MKRKTKTKNLWRRFARMLALALVLMCQLPAEADEAFIVIKQKERWRNYY